MLNSHKTQADTMSFLDNTNHFIDTENMYWNLWKVAIPN